MSQPQFKGGVLCSRISKKIYFHKKDPITFNFLRGIDCAHSRIVKMTLIQGRWWVYWSENQTFSDFYEKTVDSLVFLGGELIARIFNMWKRFLDPDSGKELVYWSENQAFSDFCEKTVDS